MIPENQLPQPDKINMALDGGSKLLQVCRQLREEAMPYFASRTRLTFTSGFPENFGDLKCVTNLDKAFCENVRYVAFRPHTKVHITVPWPVRSYGSRGQDSPEGRHQARDSGISISRAQQKTTLRSSTISLV